MQNNEIDNMTFKEKCLAAGTITYNSSLYLLDEATATEEQKNDIDLILLTHAITNGFSGVRMAAKVGAATKASIDYPIVKRVTLVSKFKDIVKGLLS
jgi:hypothetical protein